MSKAELIFNRREVLCGLGALTLLPQPCLANVIQLGAKKISSISDGNLQLPVSFLFPDVEANALSQLLTSNDLDAKNLTPECNLTLVEDGARKILFDAGAGPNFMASAGKLFSSLEGQGIAPDEITDVIFTHGHPDHIWGILDDFDEVSFPEANLHFPSVEWDYWRAEDTLEKMDEGRKTFVIGARNRMELMEDRVQLFNAGDEVISGIEAVNSAGHTPGHCSFAIHDGSNSAMVIGDAITNHVVSFLKPSWPSGSDQDPEQGIKTRLSLLDRLTNDKMKIIGYHLPNGGVGRVEKKDTAYQFVQ